MKTLYYKVYVPLVEMIAQLLPKSSRNKIFDYLIKKNNEIFLRLINSQKKKILVLLARCLQKFDCSYNLVYSVENCKECGKCKIKDIILLKKKYSIDIRVATGGSLAKKFIKKLKPDFVIAVACSKELLFGIKDVFPCAVYGIKNIIINEPCINTDVDVEEIEKAVKLLLDKEN